MMHGCAARRSGYWRAANRTAMWAVAAWLAVAAPTAPAADASDAQRTAEAALRLLNQAASVQRDRQHLGLLEALRHLRDPALLPLFDRLAHASDASLRLHGILGQAELREPEPRLTLRTLAEADHPRLQVQLISTALDEGLLNIADGRELLTWTDLDLGVKLLVALRLVEHDALEDTTVLHEGLEANRLARRGLAALMLHQLDRAEGTTALQELDQDQGPQRDPVRVMLIQAALRHDMHRAGTWAYAVATEPELNPQLQLAALRVALRFGDRRAPNLWRELFEATDEAAERNRLALAALELAAWLEADLFETMEELAGESVPLIRMARAGWTIAAGQPGPLVAEAVADLIRLGHPTANAWARRYARDHAEDEVATAILYALVRAYERGPDTRRARRLDDAVQAARTLHDRDPDTARDLLRPILTDADTDRLLVRGILLGLVRTQSPAPHRVIADLPRFRDTRSEHLALLLRARHQPHLTDRQMRDLGVLVRGGGEFQDSLRIQAAWTWLKHAGLAQEAIQEIAANVR